MIFNIVTPTTGSPFLKDLLHSVNMQFGLSKDFKIHHYIVIDGPEFKERANQIIDSVPIGDFVYRFVFDLPFNSGKNNFKGHKIYSFMPQLLQEGEFTSFLDEDNFIGSSHFGQIYQTIRIEGINAYDWFFSLRMAVNEEGKSKYPDLCESIGHLNSIFYDEKQNLIDTNCYFVKTSILKSIAHVWNRPAYYDIRDPDRVFGMFLMRNFPKFKCIMNFSLKYRLCEENRLEMFNHGNMIKRALYGNNLNTLQYPILYLLHFDEVQTEKIIKRIYSDDRSVICYNQWELNIFDDLKKHFLILDGFKNKMIPSNSVVLVHMCDPQTLPADILSRKDLKKILSTREGPNIMHKDQWKKEFLDKYFTHFITFWDDFIEARKDNTSEAGARGQRPRENSFFFPFFHKLNFNNIDDLVLLQEIEAEIKKKGKQNSCAIVLENRVRRGEYEIDGIKLEALDYQRLEMIKKISEYVPVHCYGQTWRYIHADVKNAVFVNLPSRFEDKDRVIDYYKKHRFVIVAENCNASGYVSEKIYDVWTVGSIPIFNHSFSDRLKKHFDLPFDIEELYIPFDKMDEYMKDEDKLQKIEKRIQEFKQTVLNKVSVSEYCNFIRKTVQKIRDEIPEFKYNSQFGEDKHLNDNYFKSKRGLTYLEMGAMDGVKYSNTKFFEDHLAWSGILIEPHPNNFYALQHTRPFNKNYNALISDKEEDVEFIYTDSYHSSVSCVKETMPKDHDVNYFNKVDNKVIKMKPQRMDKIFKDAEIDHIDLFILDVEGHELNVLKTINFEEISIGVFMIENLENNSNDQECKKILEENGFVFKERFEINDIYVHSDYKF